MQRIRAQHSPDEADLLLNSLSSEEKIVSIFTHPEKAKNNLPYEKVAWSQQGYYLPMHPAFVFDPLWHSGAYYVQEASSMLIEFVIRKIKSESESSLKVLDFCAAPGGKSINILSALHHQDLLVANEVNFSRNKILQENILKSGYPNTIITQNYAQDFASLPLFFDVALIDAPCSGEGMFRKDIRAIEEWELKKTLGCAKRQSVILSDIIKSIKVNGYLIYSTCTFNPDENEAQIQKLVQQGNFEIINLHFPDEWHIAATNLGGNYCYPHKVKGEGFFIAVLKKIKSDEKNVKPISIFSNKLQSFSEPPLSVIPLLHQENYWWILEKYRWKFFPKEQIQYLNTIFHHLKVLQYGTEAFEIKHHNEIPSHALALSTAINREAFATLALTKEEAVQFLQKEFSNTSLRPGIYLCTFSQTPIGFLKVNQNHLNILFPTELRIRKNPVFPTWSLADNY